MDDQAGAPYPIDMNLSVDGSTTDTQLAHQPHLITSLAICLLVVVISVWTYQDALEHDFVGWDDDINIYENPFLPGVGEEKMARFWEKPFQNLYIPITYSTWFLLARPGAPSEEPGLDPLPYHFANLVLHSLNTVLVFALLCRLLSPGTGKETADRDRAIRFIAALLGSLLFSLHPVQAEAVNWATALKDLMCGFWSLAALNLYVRIATRKKQWSRTAVYVAATAAFALALLSKPSAMVLPVIAIVLQWLIMGVAFRRTLIPLLPWFALALVQVWLTKASQPAEAIAHLSAPWTRPLIALDTVSFYVRKLIFPLNLCPEYGRTPEKVVAAGHLWFAWILPPALAAVAVFRSTPRTVRAGLLVILVRILPMLGLVPFTHQKYSTVAERYQYVGLLGTALLVAFLCRDTWRERDPWREGTSDE